MGWETAAIIGLPLPCVKRWGRRPPGCALVPLSTTSRPHLHGAKAILITMQPSHADIEGRVSLTMTWPNFFVIGAARSATDALYEYLKQHPQIYMSPVKETNYFVFYGRRPHFTGPGDEEALQACSIVSRAEYEAQFAGARSEIAIGEASPWYIYCPQVPERIAHDVPDARLIAILRHPVDRAFSSFCMLQRDCREPERDFVRALALEKQRIAAGWEPIWHYAAMGMYAQQLERYYALFDRQQLRVYLYDDLNRDPLPVLRDLFAFLGVDPGFVPDVSTRPNQSYVPRSRRLGLLLTRENAPRRIARAVLPRPLRGRLRDALGEVNRVRPTLDPALRRELTLQFRDEILRLQDLIARDLSHWLDGA